MIGLSIDHIHKSFGSTAALKDVSFSAEDGELFFLLGPSGCGKTTLLNIIAGFCSPDTGEVTFHGEDLRRKPPEKRNIGMVFQNYSLWPHMNVFDNVAYGLRIRGKKGQYIRSKVEESLSIVDMEGYGERAPASLSGGEQQRIALARALVYEPEILLLDEPLSNLDAKLRRDMRREIRRIHEKLGITMIYVTHDQDEASSMADRIALFKKNSIEQIDTPENLYRYPVSSYAADFFGNSNSIQGSVAESLENGCRVSAGDMNFIVAVEKGKRVEYPVGTPVGLIIRPEHISLHPGEEDENVFSGTVINREFHVGTSLYSVQAGSHTFIVLDMFDPAGSTVYSPGKEISFSVGRDRIHLIGGA